MDEKKVKATIRATYLGYYKDEWNNHITERVYSMPIEIDGKQVTAYISIKKEQKIGKYVKGDTVSKLKVLGWYDLDDPICGEEFKRRRYDSYYSKPIRKKTYEAVSGKSQERINLLDVQVPVAFEYVPREDEPPFLQRFKTVNREIATQIFDQKKAYILLNRKDGFLKKLEETNRNPQAELKSIFEGLNEEEKETARGLFDRMLMCMMKGKYSFEDFCTFMNELPNVARGKGLFLSREDQKRIRTGEQPTMVTTFYSPTNKTIANICPNAYDSRNDANMKIYRKRIIDINHGTSSLTYLQLGELGDEER